uniref:C2 domain-containing protein n=1 Tax=Panagrellus redivivus TaxID=6233 RepID=A0A7E4USM7_PANRE
MHDEGEKLWFGTYVSDFSVDRSHPGHWIARISGFHSVLPYFYRVLASCWTLYHTTSVAMSYQPQLIDLDQHHRYSHNDYKENRYPGHRSSAYGGSNRGSVYHKVDLDQVSSDDEGVAQVPPGGIVYDDLTTTSGSDFVPSEAYHRASRKCHGRERNLGSSFPSMSTIHNFDNKYIDSSDDEDDSLTQDAPQRLNNLNLVSPLTPFTQSYRRRPRNLEMIEEISPVLPTDKRNESDEMPPQLKPLHLSKTWNPIQTSTTTSMMPPPPPIPKTNPRHVGVTSTPRSSAQSNFNNRHYGFDDIDGPNAYMQQQRPAKVFAKPDHFGLPSQVAEKHESRGIMDLSIKIRRLTVVVHIHKATYFLDPSRPITSFVKVELKPHPKKHNDPKKRKRSAREAHRYFDSFKTDSVPRTNCPLFSETFKFKLSEANIRANDVISISVFSRIPSGRNNEAERELLGCMAFPLINLFRKADLIHEHRGGYIESSDDYVPACRGGYFLLGKMYGSKNHLGESSIRHSKYYDEIGGTSISTCSSSGISSPIKSRMMGEHDWRATPRNPRETVLTRLGVSPLKDAPNTRSGPISLDYIPQAPPTANSNRYYGSSSGSSGYPGPKKRTSLTNALINGTDSPCTSSSGSSGHMVNNGMYEFSTSNSSYSTNNSGPDFASRGATGKRLTMPSIMTTSDTELPRSADYHQRGHPVDLDLLYADTPMTYQPRHLASIDDDTTHECDDDDDSEADDVVDPARMRFDSIGARELHNDALKVATKIGHSNVRRVASFTSPPTKNQVAKASQQKERDQRRGFFGKTIKFFRGKGTTSSTSSQIIYPSLEEAKTWALKMEYLLESETGPAFFAPFLSKEFCLENLDFAVKCRQYKKLFRNQKKNKKEILRIGKEIYDEFLADNADRPVNLEASVRNATCAAYKEDLREDTFSLAQTKIEQLLANDKYNRFIQSNFYQDLINHLNGGSTMSVQSAHPELPMSSSDGESTPCATANEETPLAPNQGDRKTLRSVSAVDRIEE